MAFQESTQLFPPSDYRDKSLEKIAQIERILNIATQAYDRAIDSLNNKVSSLERDVQQLRDALANSEGYNAVKMDKTRVDSTLRVGLDMPKIAFGYEAYANPGSDPYVRVYAGSIQIGDNTPANLTQTDVDITEDDSYVYLQYAYATGALTAQVVSTLPVSDEDYFKKVLCKVGLSGAYCRIKEYSHLGGSITIPSIYADA